MKYKAYCVINDYGKNACDLLNSAGVEVTVANSSKRPNEDELVELVQKYDILIIGAKEKLTPRIFNACTKTRIIGTLSVGVDHICNEILSSDDIKVINCPNSNTISVAEHTFALLLSLKKKIIEGNRSSVDGSGRNGINGYPRDLLGSVIGIIGAGRIATEVIKLAHAFGMKILCNTRNPQLHSELLQYKVQFVKLEELLSKSDVISIHMPLNEQTNRLINDSKIDLIKNSAVFINTSRAELVDVEYLMLKADKNRNFLVGMDIDIDEYKDLFMKNYDNVIVTPHIAGVSLDAIIRMDYDLACSISNTIGEVKV